MPILADMRLPDQVASDPQYHLTVLLSCQKVRRLDHRLVDRSSLVRRLHRVLEGAALSDIREAARRGEYFWRFCECHRSSQQTFGPKVQESGDTSICFIFLKNLFLHSILEVIRADRFLGGFATSQPQSSIFRYYCSVEPIPIIVVNEQKLSIFSRILHSIELELKSCLFIQ